MRNTQTIDFNGHEGQSHTSPQHGQYRLARVETEIRGSKLSESPHGKRGMPLHRILGHRPNTGSTVPSDRRSTRRTVSRPLGEITYRACTSVYKTSAARCTQSGVGSSPLLRMSRKAALNKGKVVSEPCSAGERYPPSIRPIFSTIGANWTRLNPSDKYSRGTGKRVSLGLAARNFRTHRVVLDEIVLL